MSIELIMFIKDLDLFLFASQAVGYGDDMEIAERLMDAV